MHILRAVAMFLLSAILCAPSGASAQGGQPAVTLAPVPTGTTNEANPEIQVIAPGRISYRYSLNGSAYSEELPLSKPIWFTGAITVGGRRFTAGSRALLEFLNLRSNDEAFTDFLSRIEFEHNGSQVQATYLVNGMRTVVQPENVLNLRGAGIASLTATLQQKVPAGNRYELSALAIDGGELTQQPAAEGDRHFVLWLPASADAIALTPFVNNGQTTIHVNGQPSASGQATVIPAPPEGNTIDVYTVGPGSSVKSYSLEIRRNNALPETDYRSYYLRSFTPTSDYVSIRNSGGSVVDYRLTFNQQFGRTIDEIVREIQEMRPEYLGEAIPRKVWRFIRDNRYHWHPLTAARWNHSPALFFNSIGFGYCDDAAALFRHLMTRMGYPARVWGLGPDHVVAEAFINNRWEMWDADLQVYYKNRDGLVAGVEELAADPDLITNPVEFLPDTQGGAYDPVTASFYSTQGDNVVAGWYDELPTLDDSSMTFQIPPGGTFEFPDLYDGPPSAMYVSRAPSYANARLMVPEGFSGALTLPLVIHSIGWTNNPRVSVMTKDAAGNWDTQPTVATWIVDAEPPFTTATQPSRVYNTGEAVTLTTSEPATIYYTIDGSTPTESSPVYTAPLAIGPGTSVRFFAVDQVGNRERMRVYGPRLQQIQVQLVGMTGATATFQASASGGSGSYEYVFELRDTMHQWSIVQFFSPADTWTWNKSAVPPGTYTVRACARNSGTTMFCGALAGEVAAAISVDIVPQIGPVLVNPGDQVDDDSVRSYGETVLADGPVAYWRLEEEGGTAEDNVGGNPGNRYGGTQRILPGPLADGSAAMHLDGSTGHIRLPNSAALQLAADLTIELWINVSLASRQTLIAKDYLGEYDLTLETNGQLNLYQGNGSTYQNFLSNPGAVTENTWHHVVVTRTAATKTVAFYVDGVVQGSASYTVTPATSTSSLSFGRSAWEEQYVNGAMDEIALYATPLTPSQIAAHYALRLADGTGARIELPLMATDANGDPLVYGASGLPPGLTIDSATGLISGTLSKASAGMYGVVATASDGSLSHSQPFQWTVTHVNRAPAIAAPGDQTHAENAAVSLQLTASDADGDSLAFSAAGLPDALTIDPATGLITGMLAFTSAGTYPVTVMVSDGAASAVRSFSWTVVNTNRAPHLVNPGARTHTDTVAYSDAVRTDGAAAYWRLGESAGTAMSDSIGANTGTRLGNVTLGQGGVLLDGDTAVRLNGQNGYIRAPNSSTLQLTGDLTIELWLNVSLLNRQTLISKSYLHEFELTLETTGMLNLYQGNGTSYGNVRSVAGAMTANAWQHVVVTRTAATKTVRFYVNGVSKGSGVYATAPASSTNPVSIGRSGTGVQYVNGLIDEVALYPVALDSGRVASHYNLRSLVAVPNSITLQLSAVDPDGDPLTYSAIGLPQGLTIDASTGRVFGTVSAASVGVHQVTATASDGSLSDSESFKWTITRVNRTPTLTNPGSQSSAEGTSISLSLSATDPNGDPLTYAASGLPPGLSLDAGTGTVTGTLSFESAGTYAVTATVSDGDLSSTRMFTWAVANGNQAPVLTSPGNQTTSVPAAYAQAVVADGPTTYWRLDETTGATAADLIHTQTGSLSGAITLGQPGALADGNTAMLFNGSNGYIRVPNSTIIQLAGDLTIEMWINVSLAARQTLISKDHLREFELTLETPGRLNLYHGNGTTYENVLSAPGIITANTWQHVIVTRSANTKTVKFYVNGVAKGGGSYLLTPASGTNPVSIGRANSGVQYVNGRLDDVALYPGALSGSQAAAHYAKRTAGGDGVPITLQLSAADPNDTVLTYGAVGLPAGLSVDPETGLISGTMTSASVGTHQVTVTVSDGVNTCSQTFVWTVTD